jgi:hypothetical protein
MTIRDRALGVGWKLPLLLCALLCPAVAGAQSLRPYVDGDQLHLRSSNLRLLSAEAKKQLRNGATVTYAFRVTWTATRGGEARTSFTYHCMFSFDLWEETYKVSRREPGYRPASRLSEAAAEQQCVESLMIPVSVLPATAGFWISLIYQMEERPSTSSADDSRSIPGVLVDIFSRRPTDNRPVRPIESGPFRLADLPKAR